MNESKSSPTLTQMEEAFEKEAVQLRENIVSELQPFITGIYCLGAASKEFQDIKKDYVYFFDKYKYKQKIMNAILEGAGDPLRISKIKDVMYLLFVYLGVIESVGNSLVDILVMLLVANGRDFHIECRYTTPRIRHVTSIRDLEAEKIPLGTKLSFLEDNGIKELTSLIDTELRNSIAHLNFEIKNDEIHVKGQPASFVAVIGLRKLQVGLSVTEKLLNQLAKDRGIIPKEGDTHE